jgi:hypothetical protein
VWFYSGVDALILLGVVRDLIVMKKVQRVYWYALPALIVAQVFVMRTLLSNAPWWTRLRTGFCGSVSVRIGSQVIESMESCKQKESRSQGAWQHNSYARLPVGCHEHCGHTQCPEKETQNQA